MRLQVITTVGGQTTVQSALPTTEVTVHDQESVDFVNDEGRTVRASLGPAPERFRIIEDPVTAHVEYVTVPRVGSFATIVADDGERFVIAANDDANAVYARAARAAASLNIELRDVTDA